MDEYKLAFIYGDTDQKRKIVEGQIERVGDIHDEDVLHIRCLLDYARERYSDVEIFQRLNLRHKPETVAYFFTLLFHHAVFLNTTKDITNYGKTGMLMLPDKLTDIQRESLCSLMREIDDFSIGIFYDLRIEEGILEGKEIYSADCESPLKVFEHYLDKTQKSVKQK